MKIEWQERGTFFAECPDCEGRRYLAGGDVNRYGEGYLLFQCDAECDEGLASLDIDLEWDETWMVLRDETGRDALFIIQYDQTEIEDD